MYFMENGFERILCETLEVIEETFSGIQMRLTTLHLIALLLLDLPLTPEMIDDFGVYTVEQYQALQAVVRTPIKVSLLQLGKELNDAYGDGVALTTLVQKYAAAQGPVRFYTFWDELHG